MRLVCFLIECLSKNCWNKLLLLLCSASGASLSFVARVLLDKRGHARDGKTGRNLRETLESMVLEKGNTFLTP
jgi:hypothetical protein